MLGRVVSSLMKPLRAGMCGIHQYDLFNLKYEMYPSKKKRKVKWRPFSHQGKMSENISSTFSCHKQRPIYYIIKVSLDLGLLIPAVRRHKQSNNLNDFAEICAQVPPLTSHVTPAEAISFAICCYWDE